MEYYKEINKELISCNHDLKMQLSVYNNELVSLRKQLLEEREARIFGERKFKNIIENFQKTLAEWEDFVYNKGQGGESPENRKSSTQILQEMRKSLVLSTRGLTLTSPRRTSSSRGLPAITPPSPNDSGATNSNDNLIRLHSPINTIQVQDGVIHENNVDQHVASSFPALKQIIQRTRNGCNLINGGSSPENEHSDDELSERNGSKHESRKDQNTSSNTDVSHRMRGLQIIEEEDGDEDSAMLMNTIKQLQKEKLHESSASTAPTALLPSFIESRSFTYSLRTSAKSTTINTSTDSSINTSISALNNSIGGIKNSTHMMKSTSTASAAVSNNADTHKFVTQRRRPRKITIEDQAVTTARNSSKDISNNDACDTTCFLDETNAGDPTLTFTSASSSTPKNCSGAISRTLQSQSRASAGELAISNRPRRACAPKSLMEPTLKVKLRNSVKDTITKKSNLKKK